MSPANTHMGIGNNIGGIGMHTTEEFKELPERVFRARRTVSLGVDGTTASSAPTTTTEQAAADTDAEHARHTRLPRARCQRCQRGLDVGSVKGRKGGEPRLWGGGPLPVVKKPTRGEGRDGREANTSNVRESNVRDGDRGGDRGESESERDRLGHSRANSRTGRARADSHTSHHSHSHSNAHNRADSNSNSHNPSSDSTANTNTHTHAARAPYTFARRAPSPPPHRRRIYTDDSDPLQAAVHAGKVRWSALIRARREGRDVGVLGAGGELFFGAGTTAATSAAGSKKEKEREKALGQAGLGVGVPGGVKDKDKEREKEKEKDKEREREKDVPLTEVVGRFMGGWGARCVKGWADLRRAAPFEGVSASIGTEKKKEKEKGKAGVEKRSKENARQAKDGQKPLDGIEEEGGEVEVEVDDPLDDGRGLLSAGWGAGHAGSAFEVLAVWIGRCKNTAHNLTRPNRAQRLAEYAARRADLGLAPPVAPTTKKTNGHPRAPSPFLAISLSSGGYVYGNAEPPAPNAPGCARPLCPVRRPASLAGRKRRTRPWEEHYPPVSRGAGPNGNGVLGPVWEVPEEGGDGMDVDKEPAEDEGRGCACRALAAADRGTMKGRTMVYRFGSAGGSFGFKYDPDELRSVLFPPPPDPIPVVIVDEPMEVDGEGEGEGDAAGPVNEDTEDKDGDEELGRARKRRRVSRLEDVFAAAAMELGEVAGVGDRDAPEVREEPKEKEKEVVPVVEVEREEGEVDPEPEPGEVKMQEDGEVVAEEKEVLREKTPANVEPLEEKAKEIVEEKGAEKTQKTQVDLVTKDGEDARWSVTLLAPTATPLHPALSESDIDFGEAGLRFRRDGEWGQQMDVLMWLPVSSSS
ncbi:hypothetical protein B0H16DRAFT_1885028 [Mycena metata]|uniref:Uncharacterized protein n=1 Tax=Mycena metata TaxID=1033252 RepID=A0AAD7NET3_9AGAR|nr:hypothetical protein B0H16DRAFT_1885028 [Mycena metata]